MRPPHLFAQMVIIACTPNLPLWSETGYMVNAKSAQATYVHDRTPATKKPSNHKSIRLYKLVSLDSISLSCSFN